MDLETKPCFFSCGGATLAYRRTPGVLPGVVFLTGFKSDMTGTKAERLEAWAKTAGRAFLRFDYQGHGASSGRFDEGAIGLWSQDALAIIDHLTEGPQVLVGSSMGGWIMTLVARARPQRIAGLVGIAPAPDFSEDLIWDQLDPDARRALKESGSFAIPSAYDPEPTVITHNFIEDGRRHLVLRAPISFSGPTRLLHGMQDPDVPWQTSLRLAETLTASDVQITLIKDGDHRLSREADLDLLISTVDRLTAQIEASLKKA
ncbi:abhydrolase domain-containing protein 10 [Azospirillaceae bacterium]